jgi:hypothetical protein
VCTGLNWLTIESSDGNSNESMASIRDRKFLDKLIKVEYSVILNIYTYRKQATK